MGGPETGAAGSAVLKGNLSRRADGRVHGGPLAALLLWMTAPLLLTDARAPRPISPVSARPAT